VGRPLPLANSRLRLAKRFPLFPVVPPPTRPLPALPLPDLAAGRCPGQHPGTPGTQAGLRAGAVGTGVWHVPGLGMIPQSGRSLASQHWEIKRSRGGSWHLAPTELYSWLPCQPLLLLHFCCSNSSAKTKRLCEVPAATRRAGAAGVLGSAPGKGCGCDRSGVSCLLRGGATGMLCVLEHAGKRTCCKPDRSPPAAQMSSRQHAWFELLPSPQAGGPSRPSRTRVAPGPLEVASAGG